MNQGSFKSRTGLETSSFLEMRFRDFILPYLSKEYSFEMGRLYHGCEVDFVIRKEGNPKLMLVQINGLPHFMVDNDMQMTYDTLINTLMFQQIGKYILHYALYIFLGIILSHWIGVCYRFGLRMVKKLHRIYNSDTYIYIYMGNQQGQD